MPESLFSQMTNDAVFENDQDAPKDTMIDRKNIPFNGVIEAPPGEVEKHPRLSSGIPLLPGSAEIRGWSEFADPSDDQGQESSCVGRAWAHWLECMLRRYVAQSAIPFGQNLDARKIWARGREMFWGGDLTGGLFVHQGLLAMIDLGIVPDGSIAMRVTEETMSASQVLLSTPVVWAHNVSAAWYTPDPVSGCIDPGVAPDGIGAHCTCYLERLVQKGIGFCLFENSWGGGWGWHGLGVMLEEDAIDYRLANSFYTARLPDNWATWRGWEKYLIQAEG